MCPRSRAQSPSLLRRHDNQAPLQHKFHPTAKNFPLTSRLSWRLTIRATTAATTATVRAVAPSTNRSGPPDRKPDSDLSELQSVGEPVSRSSGLSRSDLLFELSRFLGLLLPEAANENHRSLDRHIRSQPPAPWRGLLPVPVRGNGAQRAASFVPEGCGRSPDLASAGRLTYWSPLWVWGHPWRGAGDSGKEAGSTCVLVVPRSDGRARASPGCSPVGRGWKIAKVAGGAANQAEYRNRPVCVIISCDHTSFRPKKQTPPPR